MIELTITQKVKTEQDLNYLAIALGYTDKVQDGVIQEDVIDDGGNNVGTREVPNMVDNIPVKEWIENYFLEKNTKEGAEAVIKLRKQGLEEKRKLEDLEIEKEVQNTINN